MSGFFYLCYTDCVPVLYGFIQQCEKNPVLKHWVFFSSHVDMMTGQCIILIVEIRLFKKGDSMTRHKKLLKWVYRWFVRQYKEDPNVSIMQELKTVLDEYDPDITAPEVIKSPDEEQLKHEIKTHKTMQALPLACGR